MTTRSLHRLRSIANPPSVRYGNLLHDVSRRRAGPTYCLSSRARTPPVGFGHPGLQRWIHTLQTGAPKTSKGRYRRTLIGKLPVRRAVSPWGWP